MPLDSPILLLVDDDTSLRSTASMMLKAFGYEVDTAEDGGSALKLLKLNPSKYNLVLTDLTMPDMDGREMAKRARELGVLTPFVMITGYMVDDDDVGEEFIGYLIKPFRMQYMKEKLEEFLARTSS